MKTEKLEVIVPAGVDFAGTLEQIHEEMQETAKKTAPKKSNRVKFMLEDVIRRREATVYRYLYTTGEYVPVNNKVYSFDGQDNHAPEVPGKD